MSTATERRRIARMPRDAPDERLVERRVARQGRRGRRHVSMIAAGAAFFGLLALFPQRHC